MSSRIISLNYTPCIVCLTKIVFPPFIFLVASTLCGLPCPFPQSYNYWETLPMWKESRTAAKLLISHNIKILLTRKQFSIQVSFIVVVIMVVPIFSFRIYVQTCPLREKCPNTEFFLVNILLYSD